MSRIIFSFSFAGGGVGLAWKSPGNNVNCSDIWVRVEVVDVGVSCCILEMFCEYSLAPWIDLYLEDVFPAGPLGGEVEASDA